jgi:hypothetical protein
LTSFFDFFDLAVNIFFKACCNFTEGGRKAPGFFDAAPGKAPGIEAEFLRSKNWSA